MASRWSAPLYERPGRHGPRLLGFAWVGGGRDESSPRRPLRTRSRDVGLVLKDLKTESSQAVLPLPEFCARVLEERRELQELERKIAGANWAQQDGPI
ncbi:hypothetical protein ACFV29_05455 [Streptomyces sp. NPDC059690]|uniref:hypothetical protein n=1 Tax=Streptomyces sp. NPDC059690 TaxID=3346907 RepID=UPI003690D367